MTDDITVGDLGWPPILPPIWRTMPMVRMTHGPCPGRVSDVVVKCHWYVGVVCLFFGEDRGEVPGGLHALPLVINRLKH